MKVLLLHPGLGDSRSWAPQVDALRAAGHEPVAPDLPGYGDEPLRPGRLSYVEHVAGLLDGPAAVVGCSLGERERLDEGRLHLYIPHGFRRITWEERSCTKLEIGSPLPRIRTAVDGEPVELDSPLEFRIEPGALRVLMPRAPE